MHRTRFMADSPISQTESGLVGEYIAAASVLMRGWRVALAQQDCVDLIAWHPDTSEILRLQVKACQSSRQQTDGRKRRVRFQTGLGGNKRLPTIKDYDILACVASEQRAVWFTPVTAIDAKKLTMHTDFFEDDDVERNSWAHCLDVLGVKSGSKDTL